MGWRIKVTNGETDTDGLTALVAVTEHRSFRKAADLLGVSRSSLSHAIAALERNLGVRLLHRTTRSVAPTEAGERLLRRLKPVLQDLDRALDAVADDGGIRAARCASMAARKPCASCLG